MGRALLLTGAPGVGKTTLVRRVVAALGERPLGGFTTEEVRERGRRVGFLVQPHRGPARLMAHVDLRARERVGRYGVDVAAIDAAAEEALALRPGVAVYLVDEIGKMEGLSPRFVAAMRALLDSHRRVVATLARRGADFAEEVKRRPDVELWEVTAGNRGALVERVLAWIEAG
jgi:nucleoside-triphosphatase